MSQDIDLYQNNDLAPYSPGGDLAPISPQDDWGNTDVDYLSERPAQPLPGQQVEQNFNRLATIFENDFASLGYVQRDIDKCINWFRQSLLNPQTRMPAKKSKYQLWQYTHDVAMNHFALYAESQGFSQNLIQSVCYWVQQLENLMAGQQQRQAPASDPEDALTDAEFEQVQRINEQAQARTLDILKDHWGDSFQANLRMLQQYFQSLPANEQEHLNQYSTGWIRATNTVEVLTALHAQAIGANNIPSGGALATEIAQIESVMGTKAYFKDERLQARYRELIRRRDG